MSLVGRRTGHAGQTTITLTVQHTYFDKARQVLVRMSGQLQGWASISRAPSRPSGHHTHSVCCPIMQTGWGN
jgi:hypothetical protein